MPIVLILLVLGNITGLKAACDSYFSYTQSGDTIDFFSYSTAGTGDKIISYEWTFGDGTKGILKNPVHKYKVAGDYAVCLTITTELGCTSTYCRSVTVTATSCQAYFLSSVSGDTAHFFNYSVPAPGDSIISYTWAFGDGTEGVKKDPVHVYSKTGVVTVCLTIKTLSGCTDTYCKAINITDVVCVADFTDIILGGDTVEFTNNSTVSVGDSIIKYVWTFGDGTTGGKKNPVHKYYKSGTDTVCLTIVTQLGCSNTYCNIVKVTGANCQSFFVPVVTGNVVKFNDYSAASATGDSITEYAWTFGDGTTGARKNPVHTYAKTGTYTVCLEIHTLDGCSSNYCTIISITNTSCQAYFVTTIAGDTATFRDISTVGAGDTLASYSWSFGDGDTSNLKSPVHIYSASGIDTVCLSITTTQGCSSSYCHVINIASTSCEAFYTTIIEGDSVHFLDKSKAAAGDGIVSSAWSFGDGTTSNSKSVLHVYSKGGTYDACLTIITASGCSSQYCSEITTSNTQCRASFTSIVTGESVQFNSTSIAGTGDNITTYAWSFGDGTFSAEEDPLHEYKKIGSYQVCLIIKTTLGCTSSDCQTVTIENNKCSANFTSTITGDTVQFTSTSEAATGDSITEYFWAFGDGNLSNAKDPLHVFSKSGTDTVCLTIITKSGCTSTYCSDITIVNNSCHADFSTTIIGDSVIFNNSSTAGTGDNIMSYFWTFGDSTLSLQKDPTHIYTRAGTFDVCLTITTQSGCTSSYCRTVTIVPTACNAYYSTTAQGDTITFSSLATAGIGDSIINYSWRFGDGDTSNVENPVHNYGKTGIDTVCLTIKTKLDCTSEYCHLVSFTNQNCNAYFTTSLTGDSVFFNDLSTTGTGDSIISYTWTFGDGTGGAGKNPVHVYEKSATDTICLTIITKLGCSSEYCNSIIFSNTACQAAFNTSISGDTVQFNDFSSTGPGDSIIRYTWTFGDKTQGNGSNPLHVYNETGTDTVCLTINTKFGCTSNSCSVISVVNTACHSIFSTSISGGDTVQFNNSSTTSTGDSIIRYSWSFGDGDTSNLASPVHYYPQSDTEVVCLAIYTKFGCTSNSCTSVMVTNTACQAAFNTTISGDSVQFNNGSTTGAGDSIISYSWTFGDNTSGSGANPFHVYVASGTDTVCLTINTKFGCTSNYCSVITVVNTACKANFSTSVSSDTVQFNNSSTTGTGDSIITYSWNFGDGTALGTTADPTHAYLSTGVDTVCLTITTKDGCNSTNCSIVSVTNTNCNAYFTTTTAGNLANFSNLSTVGTGDSITGYFWSYGDDSTSNQNDTTHLYAKAGTDTVCLIIFTKYGCTSTYCSVIILTGGSCQAYFTPVTSGDTADFANFSSSSPGDSIISYQWTFGDSTTSTAYAPSHVYAKFGTYEACLTIYTSGGCFNIYCDSVVIGPTGINTIPNVNYSVGQVFPNPTLNNSSVMVTVDHGIGFVLSVKNMLGQEVYSSERYVQTGKSLLLIPTANLPAGMYFVQLEVNNTSIVVRKLIKE